MDNVEIVRTVEELWNANKLDELDQYFADDFVAESAVPGLPPNLASAKMAHQGSVAGFPDRQTEILEIFGAGDKVCARMRMTGTNTGGLPPFGVAANGAPVDIQWISIYELRDGKITRHAGVNDGIALLLQLGAWAPPAM